MPKQTEVKPSACVHCGGETVYAWVNTLTPRDSVIHVCIACMNEAVTPYYFSPAYERVGQPSYSRLLEPKKGNR